MKEKGIIMGVTCIVQARMGSERLYGKVMKEIMYEPMITYTIDRIRRAKYIDRVVLATSLDSSNDIMCNYLEEAGYTVFRGDENNVLERYVFAAQVYGGNHIVRITGDCPLIDPIIIDNVVSFYKMNNYDYVRLDVPDTFIRGFDVEIFSRKALERVYEITSSIKGDSPYKEHVTYYMYTHPQEFKIGVVKGSELYDKDFRLCVDTEEDFAIVKNIFEHFNDKYVNSKEVISYLERNKKILEINNKIKQKEVEGE